MASPFIRNLTFRSDNLGVNADLVLTFDGGTIPGIYIDYYPLAWKVATFGPKRTHYITVTYRSQLAFTKGPVFDDLPAPALTFVPIDLGQKTTLTKIRNAYDFSDPATNPMVPKTDIECENGVEFKEDIGVGFIEHTGDFPDTVLIWQDVGSGNSLPVKFTPILRGYVATGYDENTIIRGQIKTPVLFEQNLTKLREDTTWILSYDDASGKFSITQSI